MNFKSIGIPTIKLLVIAAVITILLFLTNNTTEAKIAQNQADANVASRKEVLPDADDFDEKTVTVDGVEYTYYEAKNGAGYVFSGSNKGYGGAVVSMVGISSDGKVVGVKVTEASDETRDALSSLVISLKVVLSLLLKMAVQLRLLQVQQSHPVLLHMMLMMQSHSTML